MYIIKYADRNLPTHCAYDAKTYQKKTFRFHKEKDIDVLEKLAAVDSQNAYIIDLIRKDINK